MATVPEKDTLSELMIVPVPTTETPIGDGITIPAGITDLASFRQWTYASNYPERGRITYLHGLIRVDLSMEQLYSHNQVKHEIGVVLGAFVKTASLGRYMPDGMRISNEEADLSTEPDGMFATYATLREGRLRRIPGRHPGVIEVEGTPDMVLEVVSDSSVTKDLRELPEAYRRAGVPEFWRIDARAPEVRFEVLRLTESGYIQAEEADGWWRSVVFGRSFRLTQQGDPLGEPLFTLEAREAPAAPG
jgi:Uma2 family endonuclease